MFLFNALSAFTGVVLLHAVVMRIYPSRNRVLLFSAIGLLIGFSLGFILVNRFGWLTIQMFAGLALFALLCELYLFLFTLALASISANILVVLLSGSLDIKTIENIYASKAMVEKRFSRLISTGLMEKKYIGTESIVYQTTASGDRFLKFINLLRKCFGHD